MRSTTEMRLMTDEQLKQMLLDIDESVARLSDGSCLLEFYYDRYALVEAEVARRSYVRDERDVLSETLAYVSRTRAERKL